MEQTRESVKTLEQKVESMSVELRKRNEKGERAVQEGESRICDELREREKS